MPLSMAALPPSTTARGNTKTCRGDVLSDLCDVPEQLNFPRSYSIESRGHEKHYFSVLQIPKSGFNSSFSAQCIVLIFMF